MEISILRMPNLNTLKIYNSTRIPDTGLMNSLIELDIELIEIPEDDNILSTFRDLYPNLEILKIKFNPQDSLFRYQVSIEEESLPVGHMRILHLFGEADIDYKNDFSSLNQLTELKINSDQLDSLDKIYELPLIDTLIAYGLEDEDLSMIDSRRFKNIVDIQIPESLKDRQPGFNALAL